MSAASQGLGEKEEDYDDKEYSEISEVSENLVDMLKSPEQRNGNGRVFVGGKAKCLPSTIGLNVEGVGNLSLPLSPSDAQRLANVALQAPHGEVAVQNTLQFDPSQFSITHPKWKKKITELINQAAKDLGVLPYLVHPKRDKMLLYNPGVSFKKPKDTEKEEGMFGTLDIQLPSRFTGGCFVVTHQGKKERLYMGESGGEEKGRRGEGAFGCYYACYYADCDHEVEEVETGYRLVLTYSLYYDPAFPIPLPPGSDAFVELRDSLNNLPPSQTLLVYYPQHEYTWGVLEEIGVKGLRGVDKRITQAIFEAGGKGGENGWDLLFFKFKKIEEERMGCDWEFFDMKGLEKEWVPGVGSGGEQVEWVGESLDWDSDGCLRKGEDRVVGENELDWGEMTVLGEYYRGSLRDVEYQTYAFVFYKSKNKIQILCDFDLTSILRKVSGSRFLIPHIFEYLQTAQNLALSTEQFYHLSELILPYPPNFHFLSSPPAQLPSPSPYFDILLRRFRPGRGDLKLNSRGSIGNILLFLCCYCDGVKKEGVLSLARNICDSQRDSILPEAKFFLVLAQKCPLFSEENLKTFLLLLLSTKLWRGKVRLPELEEFIESCSEREQFSFFISSYASTLGSWYRLFCEVDHSKTYLDDEKRVETLKYVHTTILTIPSIQHDEISQKILTDLHIKYTEALINTNNSIINKIHGLPSIDVSTWAFPNAKHYDKDILEFLRSEKESLFFRTGRGIADAREWEEEEERDEGLMRKKGYSATIVALGTGQNAGFQVTKTPTYFNALRRDQEKRNQSLLKAKNNFKFYHEQKIIGLAAGQTRRKRTHTTPPQREQEKRRRIEGGDIQVIDLTSD